MGLRTPLPRLNLGLGGPPQAQFRPWRPPTGLWDPLPGLNLALGGPQKAKFGPFPGKWPFSALPRLNLGLGGGPEAQIRPVGGSRALVKARGPHSPLRGPGYIEGFNMYTGV